jgi:hypothetical protein
MSGYTSWSDEKLSRELDRIEKMAIVPGSFRDSERTCVIGVSSRGCGVWLRAARRRRSATRNDG